MKFQLLGQKFLQYIMVKLKSLVEGIGNYTDTNKYYDQWSTSYDKTLLEWNYRAPKKSSLILQSHIKKKIKNILDLACGTGLFCEELIKVYPKSLIDGADISKKILQQAKIKDIYNDLININFDKKFFFKKKYDLVSCIGALTYTKNPKNLFMNIHDIINPKGYFIFSHRVDLWKKQNYSDLLIDLSTKWKLIFLSRPILYLPKNSEFTNKIKIKIALLQRF